MTPRKSPPRQITTWPNLASLAALAMGAWFAVAAALHAQPASEPSADEIARNPAVTVDSRSAPALVKEGNALLRNSKAAEALQLYDRARAKQPDSREVAFVEGLGHYQLGDYEKARAAFYEAATAESPSLANDALYSVATCDHAEALAAETDPKLAISKLESAMSTYQDVLARDPRHSAARESNLKAATMWRQIKQQLEQQEKQECDNPSEQQDQDKKDQEQEKESEQEQKQNQQDREQQEQQDQQQQAQSEKNQDKQQESQQQSSDQQEQPQQQQEQDQQSASADEQQTVQEQQQAAQQEMQEERVSREQAQRQLREMVQAMKDRAKQRREPAAPARVKPVDKDW